MRIGYRHLILNNTILNLALECQFDIIFFEHRSWRMRRLRQEIQHPSHGFRWWWIHGEERCKMLDL